MRKSLRRAFLTGIAYLIIISAQSQNDRFAYSITDFQQTGAGWNALRKLNTETGEFSQVLLIGNDIKQVAYDAKTKKQYEAIADARYGNYLQSAFSTGVAAIAYDRKNDRLYYTPMFIDQLRYIDLKTMKVYYVTDKVFTSKGNMQQNEDNVVTRMVIAGNGNGYALTNDGNTFIRFSTGRNLKITALGPLVDDAGNNEISIHNRANYGGDMIADDDGNLYVISARTQMFKVNIATRVAMALPPITGLPKNYTTNGMVVDEEGKLLVSSANCAKAYYRIDPNEMTATLFKSGGKPGDVYKSSDLANSNILITKKKNNNTTIATIEDYENLGSDKIQLHPNPVTNNQFAVQFNKLEAGNYTIQLTDVLGRQIVQRKVNIMGEGQSETININPASSRGVYLVKIMNQKNKSLFTQKLVVQ